MRWSTSLALTLAAFALCQIISLRIFKYFDPATFSPLRSDDGEDNVVVIYNRIPKTGSTSFVHLAYELCAKNGYNVLYVNVTTPNSLSLGDRLVFANNVSTWRQKWPAMFHGHFAHFDVGRMATKKSRPEANFVYINVVRDPLERLVSYYYFLRYGDDYRKDKVRSRMGDTRTFDECVAEGLPDCDPKKLWFQVPWFCGHFRRCWSPPGNRWALEQAKANLAGKYFLVGTTEYLADFVDILEASLPRFFAGAGEIFRSSDKASHIRKTAHKDPVGPETVRKMKSSPVWQVEQEFYDFAAKNFDHVRSEMAKRRSRGPGFFYDKVRPRP